MHVALCGLSYIIFVYMHEISIMQDLSNCMPFFISEVGRRQVAACKHQADPNVDMDDDSRFILDSLVMIYLCCDGTLYCFGIIV